MNQDLLPDDDIVFYEPAEAIGFELKHARIALNKTQEEVASSIGISRRTMVTIENGDIGDCGLLTVMKLAKSLNKALTIISADDSRTDSFGYQTIQDMGAEIRKARNDAGITLKELEERCNINSAKLSRLESGKILHDIRLNTVLEVLECLDMNMEVTDFKSADSFTPDGPTVQF